MRKRIQWLASGLVVMTVLCLCGLSVMADDGWLTSFDDAKKVAKEENKDILLDFSGSDWCGWCIKLEKEVFSTQEWKKEGTKKFVMLLADFPKQKSLPKAQQEHNEKLNRKFAVEGFPLYISWIQTASRMRRQATRTAVRKSIWSTCQNFPRGKRRGINH